MREWEIEFKEYLKRLNLSAKEFKTELCLPELKDVCRILPLRNIKSISALLPINSDLLCYLIKQIKTIDGQKPFENASINIRKVDSRSLGIGQRFVYRENYQKLLEEVPGIFSRFAICHGLEDLGAYFIFGCDDNNEKAMACYLPPLVEMHNYDLGLVIMDGIHRNYIAKQTGGTPVSLIIDGVSAPFPCAAQKWSEIKVIPLAEKPANINNRYFELKKDLFRDLKYLGIDG